MGANLSPGLLGRRTWHAGRDRHLLVPPQSLEPLNTSTLHLLSCHSFIYLGP